MTERTIATTKRLCSIDDCEKPAWSRGWCGMHYTRWYNHGDPMGFAPKQERKHQKTGPEWFYHYLDRSTTDPKTGCIEWGGPVFNTGYGRVWSGEKRSLAHRIAWELAHGEPIPDGMFVLHSCDNPPCVNPEHLRIGTQKDNMDDMGARGRRNHYGNMGERNHSAKLTESKVRAIRAEATGRWGEKTALAQKYGVSSHTISTILGRKTWKWLT